MVDTIKLLGINFYLNQPNYDKKNWKNIIWKIKTLAYAHKERKLTLYGRIQIINTLLIPQIMHKAKLLIPPNKTLKEINAILFEFLLNPNRIENMTRSKLIADLNQGGFNMIDLFSKCETCRVKKLKELTSDQNTNEV